MSDSKNNDNKPQNEDRRDFIVNSAYACAAVGGAAAAIPMISSMPPADDVKALASIEVDISGIAEGAEKKVMWRGKPIFIRHRTADEIAEAKADDSAELPDKELDSERVKAGKEQWLVTVGICTHLGCVPLSGKGDHDAWFCPCHGSHYDTSGRIRKGPAPSNLEVPPYEFLSDSRIKIG